MKDETAIAARPATAPAIAIAIEKALVMGDLSSMNPEQRVQFYNAVCESVGLNPLTRPLEYITLQGKLTLYARKDCTEQLRRRDNIAVQIINRELLDGCYMVTAQAMAPDGRMDESIGAVSVRGLSGEAYANAIMKAETKAKRRVTLSICGLGILDETEAEPRTKRGAKWHFADRPELPALESGLDAPAKAEETPPSNPADEEFLRDVQVLATDAGVAFAEIDKYAQKQGYASVEAIPADKRVSLVKWLQDKAAAKMRR